MTEKLIMLTGKMGSGKSTAADILHKYGFMNKNFAYPIKIFTESLGFTYEQVYGTQQEKLEINEFWGISSREFMQKFGTEIGRLSIPTALPNMNMDQRTIWARAVEQTIAKFPLIVLGDGRFPDEAKLIKDYGGIIIRIERDSCTCTIRCDGVCQAVSGDNGNHASETSMDGIVSDYTIVNDGTIEDLENAIDGILKNEGLNLQATEYCDICFCCPRTVPPVTFTKTMFKYPLTNLCIAVASAFLSVFALDTIKKLYYFQI